MTVTAITILIIFGIVLLGLIAGVIYVFIQGDATEMQYGILAVLFIVLIALFAGLSDIDKEQSQLQEQQE